MQTITKGANRAHRPAGPFLRCCMINQVIDLIYDEIRKVFNENLINVWKYRGKPRNSQRISFIEAPIGKKWAGCSYRLGAFCRESGKSLSLGKDIYFRAFIKRISWLSGISQILKHSQECSNGRCQSGMILRRRSRDAISASYIIQREASMLLFLLCWAMREPWKAERATDTGFHALFFNQSVQSGKPIGHDGTIMKQNKNEELQSRRQFFKKAAKNALPILGAITLANMPMIAKAGETAMGCSSGCYTECSNTCKGGCHYGCGSTCSGKCIGSCNATCMNSCYKGAK